MKKFLLILMALMLWTCPAWADDIDDALPENTSLTILKSTRQLVQTGMSQDDATQLTCAMLQYRFPEENTIQAQTTLMETIQSGLPVDPVMNKAFEGMAKNKPAETIVQAMKQTKSRYDYAYQKAQEVTTDEESQNTLGRFIAQGMRAGLQDGDINRLMTQLQLRTRTQEMSQDQADALCLQTFQTAMAMARLGVKPDTVSHVVSQALQNRFTVSQMQQLGDDFSNQSQQGSPNQLANQFAQQFAQQMDQGENQGNSDSSNGGNAGQSGADQGSGNKENDNNGSESGNASEGAGDSESESDNTGSGSSDNAGGSEDSAGSDSAGGSEDSGGTGSGSGDSGANSGDSSGGQ